MEKKWVISGMMSLVLLGGCSKKDNSEQTESSVSVSSTIQQTTSTIEEKETTSSLKTTVPETSSSEPPTIDTTVHLTHSQMNQVNKAFLSWAGQRAAIGNMAVSDWYFDHGAAGQGDWYADTPDGQVQVQNNHYPGAAAFAIHAIGGVVFYTSNDGEIGIGQLYADSFASNYSEKMDMTKPVSKYLLADNGIVYELKTGNGISVSTNTGFGQYMDDGTTIYFAPDQAFLVSEDQAAQEELTKLLQPYR